MEINNCLFTYTNKIQRDIGLLNNGLLVVEAKAKQDYMEGVLL